MIRLEDVRFAYRGGGSALHVPRLNVPEGERCCWLGPSGCGKTTLLHLVAGIFRADRGRVTTCNVDLSRLSETARREFRITQIGMVFQDFALLDYLNVLENILLPYRISRALRMGRTVRARCHELAESVGLENLLRRRPMELSQGERQRVAVCRALIASPQLLLADEPTANLDPKSAARVVEALDSHASRQGVTLVVASHDPQVLSRFSAQTNVAECCRKVAPQGVAADG